MKKLAIIGLTLIGSTMFCAVPLSVQFSKETVVSVALDTADARVGRPGTPGRVSPQALGDTSAEQWQARVDLAANELRNR
jgi:hypothetical protein